MKKFMISSRNGEIWTLISGIKFGHVYPSRKLEHEDKF